MNTMERSVKFNVEAMKFFMYKLKMKLKMWYEEFTVYIAGNTNTYYSRTYKKRISNKTFRRLRAKLDYDPDFDACFELTEEQKDYFEMK